MGLLAFAFFAGGSSGKRLNGSCCCILSALRCAASGAGRFGGGDGRRCLERVCRDSLLLHGGELAAGAGGLSGSESEIPKSALARGPCRDFAAWAARCLVSLCLFDMFRLFRCVLAVPVLGWSCWVILAAALAARDCA